QIDELDLETGSIEERITDSKERLQSLSSELRDYQTDLEDISNQTQIVERDIVEAQQESERAVSAKNLERNETEQELNKLREENAIEDFLLESIGDSQEVRFIAMLIQNSDLTVSELCSASRTSSESIAELLEALEEEGWIALRSNGTIRILKPL
ncbi:MAG: hypothetical protein ACFFCO_11715, partial [Promethearchaeota archaeon]